MVNYNSGGDSTHYNRGLVRGMDQMERIYGTYNLIIFCDMNIFKYRSRMGDKIGADIDTDLMKIRWYERKREELTERMETKHEIVCKIQVVKKEQTNERDEGNN